MLEKEKGIDAILCATPDHSHAFITTTVMRMGKHVYCEKPLAHNPWECRQIAKVAKETGVATQLGIHGHSESGIRMVCEWVWDGAIGQVREVHGWSRSPRWRKELGKTRRDTACAGRLQLGSVKQGRANSARTTPLMRRTSGAIGGRSGPARWAIWLFII